MYADEMTSDWQTFGGVEWSVDDSGCLEIYPAADPEGGFASGQLPDNSERDTGFFPWTFDNAVGSAVIGDGVFGSGSLFAMFACCWSLSSLVLSPSFDTSQVTDMCAMFDCCSSLSSLTLPASFDISQVDELYSMFCGCSSLARIDSDSRDPRWVFDLYHALDEGDIPAEVISNFEDHIKSCYSLDDFDDDDSGYKHCLEAVFAGVPLEDVLV